jgi:hypothetical protein
MRSTASGVTSLSLRTLPARSHKAQRLAALKPGTPSVIESNYSDKVDVCSYNDGAAVATTLSTWKTTTGNGEVVAQYQGDTFLDKGAWPLAAAHVSVVAQWALNRIRRVRANLKTTRL